MRLTRSAKIPAAWLAYDSLKSPLCSCVSISSSFSDRSRERKIDVLLKLLRDGEPPPPPPLQIEIVNPREIGGDRIVTVKRDDKGKLSGLVAMNAPFSEIWTIAALV